MNTKTGSSAILVGSACRHEPCREVQPPQPEEYHRDEVADVPEPPSRPLERLDERVHPPRKPFEDRADHQLRMPLRSPSMILATVFISGTFECAIHEVSRSSSMAAEPRSGQAYTACIASVIARARAVLRSRAPATRAWWPAPR